MPTPFSACGTLVPLQILEEGTRVANALKGVGIN